LSGTLFSASITMSSKTMQIPLTSMISALDAL